jgi:hypothetical protein
MCRLLPALRPQAVPQKPIQIGGRSWAAHRMVMMMMMMMMIMHDDSGHAQPGQ